MFFMVRVYAAKSITLWFLPHGKNLVFMVRVYAAKYLPPKGGNSTECTLALRHARTVGKRLMSRRFPLPSIT